MRNLLVIGMLLVGASMAGWFQINREGDRTTIEINRNEIRSDARKAIDRGREFLDEREQQYTQQGPADAYGQQPGADQQFQYDSQPQYDQQGRQYWPEQVAAQPDQWQMIQRQSYQRDAYQQQRYPDPNLNPTYQRQPSQPVQQSIDPPLNR